MNSPLKLALSAVAALALFAAAFVGFALARGARPDEIPVVGALFAPRVPTFPPPVASPQPRAPAAAHAASPRESAARASVLDLFQLPSPFEADELAALVDELERKSRDLDARTQDVAAREERAKDRERWLDERTAELARLRTDLEVWKNDLEAREKGLAPPPSTVIQSGPWPLDFISCASSVQNPVWPTADLMPTGSPVAFAMSSTKRMRLRGLPRSDRIISAVSMFGRSLPAPML